MLERKSRSIYLSLASAQQAHRPGDGRCHLRVVVLTLEAFSSTPLQVLNPALEPSAELRWLKGTLLRLWQTTQQEPWLLPL